MTAATLQLVRVPVPHGEKYEVHFNGLAVGSIRVADGYVRAEYNCLTVYTELSNFPTDEYLPDACAAILAAMHSDGLVRLYEVAESAPVTG